MINKHILDKPELDFLKDMRVSDFLDFCIAIEANAIYFRPNFLTFNMITMIQIPDSPETNHYFSISNWHISKVEYLGSVSYSIDDGILGGNFFSIANPTLLLSEIGIEDGDNMGEGSLCLSYFKTGNNCSYKRPKVRITLSAVINYSAYKTFADCYKHHYKKGWKLNNGKL